jgi:hypothetical protein
MWKIFSVPCGSALYKFHCIYIFFCIPTFSRHLKVLLCEEIHVDRLERFPKYISSNNITHKPFSDRWFVVLASWGRLFDFKSNNTSRFVMFYKNMERYSDRLPTAIFCKRYQLLWWCYSPFPVSRWPEIGTGTFIPWCHDISLTIRRWQCLQNVLNFQRILHYTLMCSLLMGFTVHCDGNQLRDFSPLAN